MRCQNPRWPSITHVSTAHILAPSWGSALLICPYFFIPVPHSLPRCTHNAIVEFSAICSPTIKVTNATVRQVPDFMWETFSDDIHPAQIIFILFKKKRFLYAIYFQGETGTPGGERGYVLGGMK